MTDRIKGVWVAFDRDIREDDVEATINAIRCIKHVVAVEVSVSNSNDWMARERVRSELGPKIWDAIESVLRPERKL